MAEEAPVVFISFSQESEDHRLEVAGLASSLKADGCDVRIDLEKDTDEDWPSWMERQFKQSDFVLCIATRSYLERYESDRSNDSGYGVGWEAGLIRNYLYQNKWGNGKIFPCYFRRSDRQFIPDQIKQYDHFLLNDDAGYENLLRKLVASPRIVLAENGSVPTLGSLDVERTFARPGAVKTNTPTVANSSQVEETPDQVTPKPIQSVPVDSRLLDTLLSKLNRNPQKVELIEYLFDSSIVEQRQEVGAVSVVTGAQPDDCLGLFAMTCLECFADSMQSASEEDLLLLLRDSVVRALQQSTLLGPADRVGAKLQLELECVGVDQWVVLHCHIDKASKAVDVTKNFFQWREQAYNCLLYTSPSPRDQRGSRMPSSA